MLILVSYDVSTETAEGRRRLRRAAKTCLSYGQRVQKSVFECKVTAAQLEILRSELVNLIDFEQDSLRLYRIVEPLDKNVMEFGKFKAANFESTLIV